MVSQTVVQLIDDLDGAELAPEDAEEVRFGVDGDFFTIDLSRGHAGELRQLAGRYAEVARRAETARTSEPGVPRSKSSSSAARRPDLAQVRQWASANGWSVSDRGRVPADVLAAYDRRS